jgi:hypothetical protein
LVQNAVCFEKLDELSAVNNEITKNDNLVEFNGNFIDVDNIMKKLDKSETLSQTLETKLKDSNEQLGKFIYLFK